MTAAFLLLAALVVAAAVAAFTRRDLIHSALLLVATWAGIAGLYLWAGAEFVAFAQALIYVGAVSMIVLFAVLLTRHAAVVPVEPPVRAGRVVAAVLAGAAVAAVLVGAVVTTSFAAPTGRAPSVSVRQLGYQLLNQHAASLLIVGVILTVALIGATVLASTDEPAGAARPPRAPERPAPLPGRQEDLAP